MGARKLVLPIREGLNPTRIRLPLEVEPMSAYDFLYQVISTQRRRLAGEENWGIMPRFLKNEVVDMKGNPLQPESIVQPGEDIWFYRTPALEVEIPFEIKIVYEDENLLVVDKPPFLASLPRGQHITQTVLVRLRKQTGIDTLTPAHRLDRLTSGILLLTKTAQYRGAYQQLFAQGLAKKTYEAYAPLTDISPGRWQDRIAKVRGDMQAYFEPGEINAITDLVAVEAIELAGYGRIGKYVLAPHTGRTHQLRLQMMKYAKPIFNDPLYPVFKLNQGDNFAYPLGLLARRLAFMDPLSNREVIFESKIDNPLIWE